MQNEIKYNVNVILNTSNETKEEIIKQFNRKLAKLMLVIENACQG